MKKVNNSRSNYINTKLEKFIETCIVKGEAEEFGNVVTVHQTGGEMLMRSTIFDEYDLLELFNAEPKMIGPDEACVYMYSKKNSTGIQVLLYISAYENICELSLGINEVTFFKAELHNVENLRKKDGWLRIHRNNGEKDLFICFYPIFYVSIGDTDPLEPEYLFQEDLKGY